MNTQPYSLKDYDFARLAKRSRDSKEKQRYLILLNLQSGKKRSLIADMLNVSEPTIQRTLKRFRETGAENMKDLPRSGAPSKLPRDQFEAVKTHLLAQQANRPGGRLTGYDVQAMLAEKWQVTYSLANTYVLLKRLGLSWISSRSRHPKQDQAVQDDFKKTSLKPC